MKWQIIVVGKPALPWARMAVEDYRARLRRLVSLEIVELRAASSGKLAARAAELSAGSWRVVLDERGRSLGSMELAGWIGRQELAARRSVSLFIGGADGHPAELKNMADETWSLSAMTLQHELALVVLMEQIYRAHTIQRGEPYHRP